MKLTTGILAVGMMVGGAWAQNPDAIDNARSAVKSLQQQPASGSPAAKPAPGAAAPAVKPAVIPGAKAAPAAAATRPAAKPASSSADNKLEHVNVVPGASPLEGVEAWFDVTVIEAAIASDEPRRAAAPMKDFAM